MSIFNGTRPANWRVTMQSLPKYLSAIFIMTFSFNSAIADVQLTVKNAAGVKSKISFSKKLARLENAINESYILVKYSSEEISLVDPTNKQAQKWLVDGSNDNSGPAHLKLSLEKKGKGPKISGYKTNKFEINYNGLYCGTVFLAKKLLKKKEVKKFLGVIGKSSVEAQYLLAQYNVMPSDCWAVGHKLAKLYSKNGFPLKTLNSRGIVLTEVIKVKPKKDIKSSYYKIPSTYQVANIDGSRRKKTRQQTADATSSDAEVASSEEEDEEELSEVDQLKEDMKKKTALSKKNKKRVKKLRETFKSIFD